MKNSLSVHQKISLLAACIFTVVAPVTGYLSIGPTPVIIVGGSAVIGLICWYFTYLRKPVEPGIILPLFILTVAGLQIHIVEEYLSGFAPAMSRLFGIPWSERSFLMVFALIGPVIYTLPHWGCIIKFPSQDLWRGLFSSGPALQNSPILSFL